MLQAWGPAATYGPITPATSGTWSVDVRCTATPDCENATSVNVTVVAVPTAAAGPDQNLCKDKVITLSGSASSGPGCPGGLLYEWRQGTTVVRAASTSPDWQPPTGATGSITYTLVVSCAALPACTTRDDVAVTLRSCTLAVEFESVDAEVAAGGAVTLRFRTVSERDTIAFTTERAPSAAGPWTAVGAALEARGSGSAYTTVDPAPGTAPRGAQPWYRVIEWTAAGPGDVSPAVQAHEPGSTPRPGTPGSRGGSRGRSGKTRGGR